MAIQRFDWPDAATLRRELAARIAVQLGAKLAAQGKAWLAVSGGRTPAAFFEVLSEAEIDWSNVAVTLVDERWVDETSPRSNAALVKTHLLKARAEAARFVPLFAAGVPIAAGRNLAEARLRDLPSSLAVAILGMGEDGHTASYFPGGDRLTQALDPASSRLVEIIEAPGAGEPRLTLTFRALLAAGGLALHIEGEPKRAVLERALAEGPVEDMPVRAILRQTRAPLEVHWAP